MSAIKYTFGYYNDEIHNQIINDIYSDPQLIFHITPIDLFKTIRFLPVKTTPIILHANCVFIKYYDQFCIIGFDETEVKYKPYAIDKIYDIFMEKLPFDNVSYLNILDATYTSTELNGFNLIIIH